MSLSHSLSLAEGSDPSVPTDSRTEDIEERTRVPTKEGFLHKRGVFNSAWQRRWFVLRNGMLKYFKAMGDKKERGEISVDGCHIMAVSEEKYGRTLCFEIAAPATNRVFAIHADTANDLKEWVEALQAASEFSAKARVDRFRNPSVAQKVKDARMQFQVSPEFRKQAGVSSKAALWRQSTALRGINVGAGSMGMTVTELGLEDRLEWVTCSVAHNLWDCVAIGSNQGRHSVVQLVRCESDVSVVQTFRQSEGCASIDWIDDKLLIGSGNGNVSFYKCDESIMNSLSVGRNVFAIDGNNLETTFSHSHLRNPDFNETQTAPGQWGFSTRIQKIALNPISKQAFLSVENSNAHLWSLDRSEEPLHSEKGNSAVLACAWNCHTGTEFMLGGLRKHLKLYDVRLLASNAVTGQAVVWKANDVHADVIRDISWNPLSPNWVASAGDDGCAQIFDIRYGSKPMITLQCTNALYSVNWSNAHSEMLVTGGVDRALRLWNLRIAPHYLVDTNQSSFSGSIVTAQFSHKNPVRYFGTSASGEFVSQTMRTDLLESLTQHRQFENVDNGDSKLTYAKIESALYRRDFLAAYDLIAQSSARFWDQGNQEIVAHLLKLANAGLFHGAVDAVPPKYFQKLVQDISYYIPPNALKLSEPLVTSYHDIQLFKLRIALVKLMEAKKFEDIFSLENEIISQVEKSSKRQELAFDSATLQRLLSVLLPYDYLRAVNFAYRLAETYMKQNRFSDFVALVRILFYPTIYHCTDPAWAREQQTNPQTQASDLQLAQKANVVLERDLRNPKVVLAELELLYECLDKSQQGYPSSLTALIVLLEPNRKILPQVLHRLFFHSLLAAKNYDKFFIFASQLAHLLNGYHFSYVLNQMMDEVGFPKFKRFLDEYILLDRKKPWETSRLSAAMLTLVNIIANCAGLPRALKQAIPDYFKKITLALRQTLVEVRENPEYAARQGSGAKDASSFVASITEQINVIQEQKRTVSAYYESYVATFLQMLQEFA